MRCNKRIALEVHQKRSAGGQTLGNAIVLCEPCHQRLPGLGASAAMPLPSFPPDIRGQALAVAGHRCECVAEGCHV
jgi:hypothetical protein